MLRFFIQKTAPTELLSLLELLAQLGKSAAYIILTLEHAAQGQAGDDMMFAVETVDILFVRVREGFEAHMRKRLGPQRGRG